MGNMTGLVKKIFGWRALVPVWSAEIMDIVKVGI